LNGQIGLVVAHIGERQAAQPAGQKVKLNGLVEFLTAVQNQLFVLGSHLACADEKMRALLPVLDPEKTVLIETEIDARTDELPELRQFILPGGTVVGATLHVARTICRRAERAIVEFLDAPTTDFPKSHGDAVVTYMNRLGDYLFVAARWANHEADQPETIWQKE
jgi:cob(I)alamin adenosyltransferase